MLDAPEFEFQRLCNDGIEVEVVTEFVAEDAV
jgi:hypothetical protein